MDEFKILIFLMPICALLWRIACAMENCVRENKEYTEWFKKFATEKARQDATTAEHAAFWRQQLNN